MWRCVLETRTIAQGSVSSWSVGSSMHRRVLEGIQLLRRQSTARWYVIPIKFCGTSVAIAPSLAMETEPDPVWRASINRAADNP